MWLINSRKNVKNGLQLRKFDDNMIRIIEQKITDEQWSPEQIKGYCDKGEIPMICVERIYRKRKSLHCSTIKPQGAALTSSLSVETISINLTCFCVSFNIRLNVNFIKASLYPSYSLIIHVFYSIPT